jgi:hypothetical protein
MDSFTLLCIDNQGPPLPGSVLWRAAAGKHHHTRDSEPAELPQQHSLLVHPSQRLHGKKRLTDFRSKECVATREIYNVTGQQFVATFSLKEVEKLCNFSSFRR